MFGFLRPLVDLILPRHRVAERARAITDAEIIELMHPNLVGGTVWIHALWPYHDRRVRDLIKSIKYYGERREAERLGRYAADYLQELLVDKKALGGWSNVLVVPIPSSARRLRERGYNQAARIAEAIMQHLDGATYAPELLTRAERQSQVHVARGRRKDNIKGAFTATHAAAGAFIILIDDVAESGATLGDARRALLDEGAKDVIALAVAH